MTVPQVQTDGADTTKRAKSLKASRDATVCPRLLWESECLCEQEEESEEEEEEAPRLP